MTRKERFGTRSVEDGKKRKRSTQIKKKMEKKKRVKKAENIPSNTPGHRWGKKNLGSSKKLRKKDPTANINLLKGEKGKKLRKKAKKELSP